jgi:hypothetical protein
LSDRVQRSSVAQALVPALELLRDLRADLALGNLAKAMALAEELELCLHQIEGQVGSITPTALFRVD